MASELAEKRSSPFVSRMPSVSSIEGLGVLGEFDYRVDFDAAAFGSKSVRVIYAENGMGKTTFLRAVYNLLTPDLDNLQTLSEMAIRSLQVVLTSGITIRFEHMDLDQGFVFAIESAGQIRAGLQVASDEMESRTLRRVGARPDISQYLNELRQVVAPTVMVGDDRLIYSALDAPSVSPTGRPYRESERESMRRHQRAHSSSVKESLDQVERALTRMALAGFSKDSTESGVYLGITKQILAGTQAQLGTEARIALEHRADSILTSAENYEIYGLISLQQVRSIVEEIRGTRANSAKFRSLYPVLDPYLSNLSDQVKALKPAQRLIDTFVTSVNSFLNRKELRFSTAWGISLVSRQGEVLDPDSLSSGEKHLLLLLSNAVLATFTGSLVIIDEPELSLGLTWQRSLLSELQRCTAGSGVQFLVASHSVQIMGDIDEVVSPTEAP